MSRSKAKMHRFNLVYQGRSKKHAEIAASKFWAGVPYEEKLNATSAAIAELLMLKKGLDFHALKFHRTTAVIRKP